MLLHLESEYNCKFAYKIPHSKFFVYMLFNNSKNTFFPRCERFWQHTHYCNVVFVLWQKVIKFPVIKRESYEFDVL